MHDIQLSSRIVFRLLRTRGVHPPLVASSAVFLSEGACNSAGSMSAVWPASRRWQDRSNRKILRL